MKKSKEQEQEDGLKELGVVIEDKEVVFWKELKEKSQKIVLETEKELKIHKAFLELCENKIRGLPNATYIG